MISIVVALPRVSLTPARLRVKNMLAGVHSAPDCILPPTPELRAGLVRLAESCPSKYNISDERSELNTDLGFLWDEIYKLSLVQSRLPLTNAKLSGDSGLAWSTLWYPVVVVVSVGDDHNDLWLLVQGLGLRTKLAPLQYQLNGCLQIQQALENRGGGSNIPDLQIQPGKNKPLDLM